MQEKNQKKNKKKGYLLIFGVLLIFVSIGILVNKYYQRNEIQNIEENICDATILGFDKYRDIAILKSNKSIALGTVILSDSSKIELGDTVFTIGTPLSKEYYGTLTQGIISYKDRLLQKDMDEEVLIDTIQTTTTINPGNSGGPLFNINGEVIGVISSKIIKNEVEGLGFAIPINDIKPIIEQLENGQDIKRLYTNMDILDLNNDYELYKNELYLDQDYSFGVYVKSIYENSIFSKILQEKDIILKVNGENIKSSKHFEYLINKYSNIKLEVKRNDEIIILDFTN